MNSHEEVFATLQIEPNIAQYDTFFDHKWARSLSERSPVELQEVVNNLCLTWKMAANTHRLPWLMVHQLEAFADGYTRRSKPDMVSLVEQFRDWVISELDGKLQRVERKAINEFIKKIDQKLRLASQTKSTRIPVMDYWNDISQQSEMAFSVTGSQNLTYCALIFAYEWFLVGCFRALGGEWKLQTNSDKFWKQFKERLGRDVKPEYWEEPEDSSFRPIAVARLARNCIAHTGGIAKEELISLKHDLAISPERFILIQPSNSRDLFNILKGKVDALLAEVTPKLSGQTMTIDQSGAETVE